MHGTARLLAIVIPVLISISIGCNVFAGESEADLLKALTAESASRAQKQLVLTRLLKMDLNPESQTRIADHVVGELTGDAGTLEDMAQVVTVLVQMNDVPGPRRMEYARSLGPLMTAPSTPNGQEITVADRCAIAAAIRACNRDNQESSQFLIEQAKKGVSPAYVMIGLCNATEAIPVLVERLKMAENEPKILMLIMALNRMSVDVSVRQQIGIAREKLSPMARAFIQKQLKVNNAPVTESPAE